MTTLLIFLIILSTFQCFKYIEKAEKIQRIIPFGMLKDHEEYWLVIKKAGVLTLVIFILVIILSVTI